MLVSCLIYSDVIHHEFVYDDYELVVNNAAIRDFSLNGIFSLFKNRDYANFLPIRMLSYSLDYLIWKENPVGYHITNIVLHAMNSALVIIFTSLLLNKSNRREKKGANAFSAVAAGLFFAVHPLHVEAVAWISGRKEVLYSFFFLSGMIVHICRRNNPGFMGGGAGFVAVVVCMVASQLSKGTAVAFPFAVLLIDILFFMNEKKLKMADWMEHAGLFAVTFSIVAVNMKMAVENETYFGLFGGNVTAHILTIVKIVPFYLSKTIWPFNLSIEYGVPVSYSLIDRTVLLSVGILASGIAAVIFLWKRVPMAAFGILFFVVALGPTLNVIPFGVFAADRYTYLALMGPAVVAALISGNIKECRGIKRTASSLLMLAFLLLFIYATHIRNADWENQETLWKSAVNVSPGVARAHVGLGRVYMFDNRFDEAETQFRKALESEPDDVNTYVNLSLLYVRSGKPEKAAEILSEGLVYHPGEISLCYNMSASCLALGDYECAARFLAPVMAVKPDYLMTKHLFPVILNKLREDLGEMKYGEFIKSLNISGKESSRERR